MTHSLQIPRATYRLQLNRSFTFAQATAIVPYLAELGISHCYISPCLKARPGSMHGYDIVDHNSFNPEIGTREEFDHFVDVLHQHEMGLIMDIVPNHMGVMGSDNAWWLDVLENGEASIYASYFDIDWQPLKDELRAKILVPVLHDHYGVVLESGDLKLSFDATRGDFSILYHEHRFPVNPKQYPRILQHCVASLTQSLGEQNPDLLELQSLITAFGHLPARQDITPEHISERNRDKEIHKRRLAEVCARCPQIADCIQQTIQIINGNPADPPSFEELHELIKVQAYRLANWRVAADDINYRRFFDTNDLAAICMENAAVFETTHHLVLSLIAEGKVDGLRVDHPDGLYDPVQYFERLKDSIATALGKANGAEACSADHYVLIEKILIGSERLPDGWAVCGTTGYDFMNLINGLFIDSSAAMRMERVYRNFTKEAIDFEDLAYRCRKLIMRVSLASELNVLANHLMRIALSRRRTCDFTLNSLREALTEVVASFPVYRTYVSSAGPSETDERYIRQAIAQAKQRSPAGDTSIFDFVSDVLLTRIAEGQNAAYQRSVFGFAMKFQQFTSPVMAKGVEDTAYYRFNRMVSLEEVGSDLLRFGIGADEFHAKNQERLQRWPHTMLATGTHDSKRAEDVRMRIDTISEMPGIWRLKMSEWRRFTRAHRKSVYEKPAPSPNDEYLLYQTLVGAWPLDLTRDSDSNAWKRFTERIESYMLKAMREGKRNTSWINPNADYEAAVSSFIRALLDPNPKNRFLSDFLEFVARLTRTGLWSSLSQTALKLTSPGVPDIYQGNELWDFSLVDPDNRRPVDYGRRRQMFDCIRRMDDRNVLELLRTPEDGRLKMYVIWRTLSLRRANPALFERGEYVPLRVQGAKAQNAVAFLRKLCDASLLVVAPRLISTLLGNAASAPVGAQVWEDTRLVLPQCECGKKYVSALSQDATEATAEIRLSDLLAQFPVGLFQLK